MASKLIRIKTSDDASVEQGAQDIADMFTEIEASLRTRRFVQCPYCYRLEWMEPTNHVCWKCRRLALGLVVMEKGLCVLCDEFTWIELGSDPHICWKCSPPSEARREAGVSILIVTRQRTKSERCPRINKMMKQWKDKP